MNQRPLPLRDWSNGQLDGRRRRLQYSGMPSEVPWIAVVDDDPSVLRALQRLLRTHAFHPKTFASAREFLAALAGGLPECLIVDLQMPEMSGLELHQHLTNEGIAIPTIIITAHDDSDARRRCEAAGIAAYLLKPLEDVSFFAAINTAINKARGLAE
jgi:FixJ family two-component response regulator